MFQAARSVSVICFISKASFIYLNESSADKKNIKKFDFVKNRQGYFGTIRLIIIKTTSYLISLVTIETKQNKV